MERPLEIVFHNMAPSAEIEGLVREKVAKLEKFYPRMIGCRVAVELPHKQHKTGNIPEVHVEIQVPGQTLVVRREHHVHQRRTTPDARSSVREAFDAAKLRLQDFKRKQAREVKPHPAPLRARVSEILAERDYGFITTAEGKELYFHRNSVMDGPFDELKRGDAVHFIEGDGDTGPTAAKVWLANGKDRS
jgi:cold shock CspA family protein/ribosome-associated translation inhibitor RaiA